jgi:integrase
MKKGIKVWSQKSIKEIGYGEIEDFLLAQKGVSAKTKANLRSALNDFWTWLRKRKVLTPQEMPEIPVVHFESELRKTIERSEQIKVLEEVRRISYGVNPRIWIGVKWLMTYISIRPGELVRIKEGDIRLENKGVLIPRPKEKEPKFIPLRDEDVQLVKNMPRGFPELPFFRHTSGRQGCKIGDAFGHEYLSRFWKEACNNLGIQDVCLYAGTKHSTACNMDNSPEEIKRATMHKTNKAFERYYRMKDEKLRKIYNDPWENQPDNDLTTVFKSDSDSKA